MDTTYNQGATSFTILRPSYLTLPRAAWPGTSLLLSPPAPSLAAAQSSVLGCDTILEDQDWSECFRERFINTALPLAALAVSLLIFAVQYALSKRKHARSAIAVAQLDPTASSFALNTAPHVPAGSAGQRSQRSGNGNFLTKALATLLPWNSSKLLASQSSLPGRDGAKANGGRPAQGDAPVTAATLAVFRTENAMILNEVHSIDLNRLTEEEVYKKRILNLTKRTLDTVGAVTLVGVHAAAWVVLGGISEIAWAGTWAYLAILGGFSLGTSHSLYTHKAALFITYFIVAFINLRSAVISDAERIEVVLRALETALVAILLVPTFFFPLDSKAPVHLAAIHRTMRARKQFGEPTTAIPTPAPRSPAKSSYEDDASEDSNGNTAHGFEDLSVAALAFSPGPSDDKDKEDPPSPPEVTASLYSRLYFSFVTPAIVKHYKEQFTLPAVPDLPPGDKAAAVVAAFRADSSRDTHASQVRAAQSAAAARAGAVGEAASEDSGLVPSSKPLPKRLFMHFLPMLILQAFWAGIEAILSLTPAIGLRKVLAYIAERDAEKHGGPKATTPVHMAFLYVLMMALGQCLAAICASQALFIGRRVCIRLRAILITEIVSKALRRSDSGARKEKAAGGGVEDSADGAPTKGKDAAAKEDEDGRANDGQVVNLVSVDVFKVSEICAYLHFAFPSAPTTIIFSLYLLYDLLGWSALVGFAVLLCALPAQTLVARLFVRLQKALLEATDNRLNLTTEVLNCIKTVKFFAWEDAFAARLGEARVRELRVLRNRSFAWLLSAFSFIGTPVLVTVVTFGAHTQLFKQPLNAETAFTALALFNLLRLPMDALPDMIVQILSALVSVRRIDKFLREPETLKYEQLLQDEERGEDDPIVGFQDASFVFKMDSDDETTNDFVLRDLNLTFPEGKLSIIAGSVGSGKTCLLLSLLGETHRISGRTFMPCPIARALEPIDPETGLSNTVAYVSQSAWLLGTTVRENILFGSPYNEQRYKAVLKACSLEPDLKILEYHDETEVGEKGTSLSGGQKARVALARALYSPAKYVLIDDALSAVDAHTAEHLYKNYLLGPLMKGRTCILVTHSVSLVLPGSAYAVLLDNGRVTAAGASDVLAKQGIFDHETGPRSDKTQTKTEEAKGSEVPIEELDENARASEEAEIKLKQDRKNASKLEETYGKGAVGRKQYALYTRSFFKSAAACVLFWVTALGLFATSRSVDVGMSAWLRKWAASYSSADTIDALHNESEPNFDLFSTGQQWSLSQKTFQPEEVVFGQAEGAVTMAEDKTLYYLTIYLIWAVVFISLSVLRDAALLFGALRASRNLYERMTNAILRARPQFFDRTPVGRIMNRFSKDLETIDQDISPSFLFLLDVILQGAVILVVSSYALPAFMLFSVFIIAVYASIGALYIVSSRDLKRIESVQRSPIFTLVGEVLGGVVAIRAYGDAARFTRHCLRLVDKASRPFFFLWYENRWLSMRVDTFAGLVSLVVGIGLILNKNVDAALAGFTLAYTIQLVDAALWTVRMITQNEINFNSVERIGEYLNIEAEEPAGQEPPAAWPTSSGTIAVEDLTVRYSPEFEPVLKGVSFEVQPGEKVGIVGRTGSGKSTLALSFFRFLEAEAGSIIIDGIPIASVPLKTLRSRLTVIPQDAQLFSGTIKSNLDPFGQFEDSELWLALQRCKLASADCGPASSPASRGGSRAPTRPASPSDGAEGGDSDDSATAVGSGSGAPSLFNSLEAPIEQGGRNLSSGQRQLLALARGLLKMRDSRILILDESTANLDSASDQQIQGTIRTEMAPGATILVIAHRLRTIIDFDKILVLDKGKVLEYDSPGNLLRNEQSSFHELCERSGEMEILRGMAESAEERKRKSSQKASRS